MQSSQLVASSSSPRKILELISSPTRICANIGVNGVSRIASLTDKLWFTRLAQLYASGWRAAQLQHSGSLPQPSHSPDRYSVGLHFCSRCAMPLVWPACPTAAIKIDSKAAHALPRHDVRAHSTIYADRTSFLVSRVNALVARHVRKEYGARYLHPCPPRQLLSIRVTLKTKKSKPVSRNRAPDETKRNSNGRAAREPDLPSTRNETAAREPDLPSTRKLARERLQTALPVRAKTRR
jgi:hypothetical protein